MNSTFLIEKILDPVAKENFLLLKNLIESSAMLKGDWAFKTYTFTKAETNKRIPHKLGFIPMDILQTSLIGAGSLTWNYNRFDKDFLDVTTSGACVVRAFIGRYPQ